MKDERDPVIESLFTQAERQLEDSDFADRIMARVNRRRRRIIGIRVAIVLALVILELVTSEPIQNYVGNATQLLSMQLLDLGDSWYFALFSPLNSVLGIVGLILIAMQFLYRRIVY
jgi:hypothetical protein